MMLNTKGTGASPPERTVRSMTRPPMPSGGKRAGKAWVMVCPVPLGESNRIDTAWRFPDFLNPSDGEIVGLALRVSPFKPADEKDPMVHVMCMQGGGMFSSAALPLTPGFRLHELSLAVVPGDSIQVSVEASSAVLFAQATLLFKAAGLPSTVAMVTDA